MKLRQAEKSDFNQIMKILKDGANQLAERGIDQWQGEYPSPDQIKLDIEKGWAYLAESDDNETIGAISIVDAPDKSYDLLKGNWKLDTDNYVVVHRIAIHSDHAGHGYATKLFEEVFDTISKRRKSIESIRIDTHKDNKAMQHLIDKMEFQKVGEIHGVYRKNEISYVYEYLINRNK